MSNDDEPTTLPPGMDKKLAVTDIGADVLDAAMRQTKTTQEQTRAVSHIAQNLEKVAQRSLATLWAMMALIVAILGLMAWQAVTQHDVNRRFDAIELNFDQKFDSVQKRLDRLESERHHPGESFP